MLVSLCVFGFGPVAKDFVQKFRALENYGIKFRIHVVVVNDLNNHPDIARNSNGYAKLSDEYFEDEYLALNVVDDLEWLREDSGYGGHDVVVDCSDEGDYFAEEIEYQMSTNSGMLLYKCTELDSVNATIEKLVEEMVERSAKR